MKETDLLARFDREHLWHPYSAMDSALPVYTVAGADGVRLRLDDGRELIDGMASWWCMIHGYNHPDMNAALHTQVDRLSHVMFGGLTHAPAVQLAEQLVALTPDGLDKVFFADSGSVSVEVALKMAIQYWHSRGEPHRQRFISLRSGYHGDTFGAMSVCDPVTGMHSLFNEVLPQNLFAPQPVCRFGEPCSDDDIQPLANLLQSEGASIAALVMEPIVQGAGGMWFYSADYLARARELCDRHGVLLILDEIATGFGRTGKMFASEYADVTADILCVGKALTGGYMTLAATLTTAHVAEAIDAGDPGLFMHGPTFMANPLACSAALASIRLLLASDWQADISRIEQGLQMGLAPCRGSAAVKDVRVLGAIGVVELHEPVDMKTVTEAFVSAGVWVRPFGRLVYLMPPYVISDEDLATLTSALCSVVAGLQAPQ